MKGIDIRGLLAKEDNPSVILNSNLAVHVGPSTFNGEADEFVWRDSEDPSIICYQEVFVNGNSSIDPEGLIRVCYKTDSEPTRISLDLIGDLFIKKGEFFVKEYGNKICEIYDHYASILEKKKL